MHFSRFAPAIYVHPKRKTQKPTYPYTIHMALSFPLSYAHNIFQSPLSFSLVSPTNTNPLTTWSIPRTHIPDPLIMPHKYPIVFTFGTAIIIPDYPMNIPSTWVALIRHIEG